MPKRQEGLQVIGREDGAGGIEAVRARVQGGRSERRRYEIEGS